jgi:hypothetical protein
MYYKLTGSATQIQRVIQHFSLRVERQHSSTDVDVECDDEECDDLEIFADSLGVAWKEI